jgi:hypothetical protein
MHINDFILFLTRKSLLCRILAETKTTCVEISMPSSYEWQVVTLLVIRKGDTKYQVCLHHTSHKSEC